jgi:crotonobetainyl-CoA:carnitine CoA-transferase CaiB-like acyl-CoA transferase
MDRQTVERAVALAGLSLPPDARYEIDGEDPILSSPHRIATGASVGRLLTGLAAGELWRLSTGRSQRVTVDARHAVANLRALDLARPVGTEGHFLDDPRQPMMRLISRLIEARDGRFIQMHPNFSEGPRILEVLGLDADAGATDIDDAVRRRDAFELEAALVDRRLCGGVVRSKAEWSAHPQGQAIAHLPAVTITKIGEAPPRPLPGGERPASGIRVLDLTRILAGPTCAKTLAEHGADVLHVGAPPVPDAPSSFETNIGKRHASIDLRTPEGVGILEALAADADVFSQGYRRGSLDRRGFGPQRLATLRPGIVYVSENCYGPVGPWAERPGWEQLAQAATGIAHREGEAHGGPPRLAPLPVNDYTTGFFAAYGTMAALAKRATEGGSWHVEVSLCQTAMWYQRLGDADGIDPAAPGLGDISAFMAQMDSPDYGRIEYLTPAVAMSETAVGWDLPPVPLGRHASVWLPRS